MYHYLWADAVTNLSQDFLTLVLAHNDQLTLAGCTGKITRILLARFAGFVNLIPLQSQKSKALQKPEFICQRILCDEVTLMRCSIANVAF